MNDQTPDLTSAPQAWRGEELFARDDWQQELTDAELQEIDEVLEADLQHPEPHESWLDRQPPFPELGDRLARIQSDLENQSGACMLRGLPVSRVSIDEAKRLFLSIAGRIGTPLSQSAAGERVFSVRDEGFQVGHPRARGPNTRKRLSFHTDRCDVIAFLCLRQAKSGGENQLVSSVTLYNEIRDRRPDLLGVLMQPFYYARHNVDVGNERPWCKQPIFSFTEGQFACSYLRVLIDRASVLPELPDLTDGQIEALKYLEDLAADPSLHVTFRQQPGDLLLLNNWVTLHRRNEFDDYDEPARRRHILRIWLSVPNSRPIDPLFAENYGATAAGAIRGGMKPATAK